MKSRKRKNSSKLYFLKAIILVIILTVFYIIRQNVSDFAFNFVKDSAFPNSVLVENVEISGCDLKTKKMVFAKTKFLQGKCILDFSAKELKALVSEINWVETCFIRKILPNIIRIDVKQRQPVAIWQNGPIFSVVDKNGYQIETTNTLSKNLPIVSGENSEKQFYVLLNMFSKFKSIKANLKSMNFVRNRRWDLFINEMQIKLPDSDVENSLKHLDAILQENAIQNITVSCVDLRVKGKAILKIGKKVRKVI